MSDSTEPVPVRTSFTADEIDTIYNDLWAAGYVLHCTDILGSVLLPHNRPQTHEVFRCPYLASTASETDGGVGHLSGFGIQDSHRGQVTSRR